MFAYDNDCVKRAMPYDVIDDDAGGCIVDGASMEDDPERDTHREGDIIEHEFGGTPYTCTRQSLNARSPYTPTTRHTVSVV